MGTSRRFLLVVGALLFACDAPAHAQDDGTRHGFWFGLGLGYGSAHVACDTCSSGPRLGRLGALFRSRRNTESTRATRGRRDWLAARMEGRQPPSDRRVDRVALLLSAHPRRPIRRGGNRALALHVGK